MTELALVSLVVAEYDEAIEWYRSRLGFDLVEDTAMGADKRWVVMRPPGAPVGGAGLLLARAATPEQRARVGDQTGGRVFLFLHTDRFDDDVARLDQFGVERERPVRHEPFGRVVVFEDLYGTRWDLIEKQPLN